MFYEKLKDFYLFQEIDERSIEKINRMPIIKKEYKSGELINVMGDKIDYIHVILKGSLKTNEYNLEGNEIVSSYYFENDAFPFYLIYGGEKYYPYNIYCHKDATVYHIPVGPLIECISQDIKFMDNVLRFVSKYTCYNKKVIRTVRRPKVSQRLAEWIIESSPDSDIFVLPGTQDVFAKMLCVNRSVLNQEIKKLESENVIRLEGRKMYILNRNYLKNLLES